MAVLMFGPGRDEDMGLKLELVSERVKKLDKPLGEEIEKMATFVAEGWVMTESPIFQNGSELSFLLKNTVMFAVAGLMEKGLLSKTLPKKAAGKEVKDERPGQYL